jgi:uncharacterized protein (TIGR02001 family)
MIGLRPYGGLAAIAVLVFGMATAGAARAEEAAATDASDQSSVESMFDVAFGIAVTSNYVSRGITQTEDKPAVQGYVEFDAGQFYAGAWTSNVSFGGSPDQEVDLSAGWRPEVGKFSFDFGYVQYVYLSDIPGLAFGEAYANVDFAATDNVTIGGKAYYAPNYALSDTHATYVEANADVTLPNNLGISGAIGYQNFDAAYGASYASWNAGIYWQMTDATKIDLRYSDTALSQADCGALMGTAGTECGAKVMLSLSVDLAASDLGGGN